MGSKKLSTLKGNLILADDKPACPLKVKQIFDGVAKLTVIVMDMPFTSALYK